MEPRHEAAAPAEESTPASGNGAPGPAYPALDSDALDDLPRRERERLVRRQLMLDAARSVFAEKGYSDATLEEIAQRAEFGKGTLYNYFEGGKEEILFAVFDDLYAALDRLIEHTFSRELVRQRPFREVFEGLLTAMFGFFIERQDQFMIMIKEGQRLVFDDTPEKSAYFLEQGEGIIRSLTPAIEEAQERGILRDFPPHAVAHMIMGNVKGYHMHQCMADCQNGNPYEDSVPSEMPAPKESARFLTTFLLDGLLSEKDD